MEKKTAQYLTRGKDYEFKEQLFTLPGKYYTSEDIYQEELEKIFYNRWLLVGREEQIPKAGDYFLYNIGDESLIITRDSNNDVYAHFNVCRHRGTRMCMEEHGHFKGKSIQCPYHAWTYNLKGELSGAPLMNELKQFDKKNYPLHSAKVKT
ncbi:MAG TPA: Rieske (2Fe-2S) protein, partial [Nitrosopumilaceae archaeon]|nr:Rieske (2Fe-2S) protein [Nitrosopumilaceae archaeon]